MGNNLERKKCPSRAKISTRARLSAQEVKVMKVWGDIPKSLYFVSYHNDTVPHTEKIDRECCQSFSNNMTGRGRPLQHSYWCLETSFLPKLSSPKHINGQQTYIHTCKCSNPEHSLRGACKWLQASVSVRAYTCACTQMFVSCCVGTAYQ